MSMEKRNLVEPNRTPRLNKQEQLDAMEKSAVALFKRPDKPCEAKKCAKSGK